jgi:type II secretory pathway pseudopilin PulG
VNTNRIWALGTVIAIVAVLALGYLLGVQPMLNRLDAAKAETVTTQANNAAQEATLAVMKGQYENLDELRDELEVLRISIPGTLDSDFVYQLFAGYSTIAGATIDSITLGEAQLYGVTSEGSPTVEGVEPVANLYTIPVTIGIRGEDAAPGLAFVAAMQRGPRLFLVTSYSAGGGEEGSGGEVGTITGYMFVLADPAATPEDAANALLDHPLDPEQFTKPLGGPRPTPTPTPTPTDSETPDPSESATPTPTSTTGP